MKSPCKLRQMFHLQTVSPIYAWRFSGQWDVQRHPNICTHHFSQNPPSQYGHLWTADSFNGFSFVIACIVIQCFRARGQLQESSLVNCVWMVRNGCERMFVCTLRVNRSLCHASLLSSALPPSLPTLALAHWLERWFKKKKKDCSRTPLPLGSSSTFFPPLQVSLSPPLSIPPNSLSLSLSLSPPLSSLSLSPPLSLSSLCR